jgi:hypothetical protein
MNQWIEIKNISPYTLDLSHVSLVRSGGPPIPLSGILPPTINQNFLVIAPGAPNYFGAHVLTISFPALATTTAEQLSLVWNASTTIDATPPISACNGWCAGVLHATLGSNVEGLSDLVSPLSMERKPNTPDGTRPGSWQTTDSYSPWIGGGMALWGTSGGENSGGLPDAGVYCGSPANLVTPGTPPGPQFNPGTSGCKYLSRFITGSTHGAGRYGGLYEGDVASSTGSANYFGNAIAYSSGGSIPAGTPAGQHFFFAIWENRSYGNDMFGFNFYFTQGASSTQGINGPPHGNYVIIPFTYQP